MVDLDMKTNPYHDDTRHDTQYGMHDTAPTTEENRPEQPRSLAGPSRSSSVREDKLG